MTHPVRLLAASLILAASPLVALHAQQAEHFDLAGTDIRLYNLAGTLDVMPATGGSATVELTRHGGDAARLTVTNDGGTLIVVYPGNEIVYPQGKGNNESSLRVRDDGTFDGDWHGDRGRKVRISSRGSGLTAWADIRISLPAGARADLHVGVGHVTLANVDGTISVSTSSGDVETRSTGGTLSIDTGSGDVTMTGHDGDLSIDTGSGDILLSGIKSADLSLDTGSGDVRVDGLTGEQVEIDTGSGEVVLRGAAVRVLSVDTGSGDVQLGFTTDIDDLSVDSGSGSVEVTAQKTLGAMVEVETSSGDITTEFPLQVTHKGRDGLSGTLGDGKGKITIDTASGDVTLKRLP